MGRTDAMEVSPGRWYGLQRIQSKDEVHGTPGGRRMLLQRWLVSWEIRDSRNRRKAPFREGGKACLWTLPPQGRGAGFFLKLEQGTATAGRCRYFEDRSVPPVGPAGGGREHA